MTNISQFEEIGVGKKEIEVVSEYKYLGQTMPLENRTKNELKIRRANAWKIGMSKIDNIPYRL